jgi:hypothetical protein
MPVLVILDHPVVFLLLLEVITSVKVVYTLSGTTVMVYCTPMMSSGMVRAVRLNSTCCQFNNPPWFTKNLPTLTTDAIELRICTNSRIIAEDVRIELVELYVR